MKVTAEPPHSVGQIVRAAEGDEIGWHTGQPDVCRNHWWRIAFLVGTPFALNADFRNVVQGLASLSSWT